MRPRLPILLSFPVAFALTGTAYAHAHLKTAVPSPGGVIAAAPAEVAITFTEGVEPKYSSIEVQSATGERVDRNDAHTAPGDATRFIVGLNNLAPGVYQVIWHATAVDTHKTDGVFQFTVQPGAIAVSEPWARATAGASKTGAAYVTVTASGAPDQITGASTPVAGMVDLHETINANGVMQMRPLQQLALEPGKPVTMAPGGYHLMLMDVKRPLKQGDTFPLTLTFAHAQPVTVQVMVAGPGATAPGDASHTAVSGGQKP